MNLTEQKATYDVPGEQAEDVTGDEETLEKKRARIRKRLERISLIGGTLQTANGIDNAGVAIRVPDPLASEFPTVEGGPDGTADLPPHITMLWIGEVSYADFQKVTHAVRCVSEMVDTFRIDVTDYGEFENKDGATIPHMIPRSWGPVLEGLHRLLIREIRNVGIEPAHHEGPFKPHITLGYVESGTYSGPRPRGSFWVDHLEVWGFGSTVEISLASGVRISGSPMVEHREPTTEEPIDVAVLAEQESFDPPQGVQDAAARGLELRREFGRGGTPVGIARARDLSNGRPVSRDTIRRMVAFFDRHEGDKDTPPEDGNGMIAWLLWGGDPGREWAESIQRQLENGSLTEQAEYTEQDWDGDASRFTTEELSAAIPNSVLEWAQNRADSESRALIKADLKLPFREPDGRINLNAVRSALAVLGGARGGVDLPQPVKDDAREELQNVLSAGNEALNESEVRPIREALIEKGWKPEWVDRYISTFE